MPLVCIDHPPSVDGQAIGEGVHLALVETFGVPPDDHFQIIAARTPGRELVRPPSYLGLTYSDAFTVIQITCNDTRTVEQKKALYAAIAGRLSHVPGVRATDLLINLVEVKKENWSFGDGIAQYA